jgi:4a-hydroxytetrahydrobiopterin dehydratase
VSPVPPEDRTTRTPAELATTEGLDDWRYLAGRLHARFATADFATGVAMLDRIGVEADAANHHPDVELRYKSLDVHLMSHDVGGVTDRDVRLARTISAIAAEAGATAQPGQLVVLGLALDTPDAAAIRPFWQALLGLVAEPDDDHFLFDPQGRLPGLFLQPTDAHEAPRQRFHIDLDVPPETVPQRIEAALAAGGTLVSDAHAPAWWTLADPQGNQVDLATWEGRE